MTQLSPYLQLQREAALIRFVPRGVAERIQPLIAAALISIRDSAEGPAELQSGWSAVLPLVFDDVDAATSGKLLFDAHMAEQILTFAQQAVQQGQALVVHCHAGVSRSAAVAIALGEYFGLAVYKEMLPCPAQYALYNRKVYRVLSQHLHGYGEL